MRDSDQSSTSSRSTSSLLSDLHQALAALNLASTRVSRLSATLARRGPSAASATHPSSLPLFVAVPVPTPSRVPLLRGGSICRGDFVTVNNSKGNQPYSGIVSHARSNFIYLRSADGTLIHRYEKNLTLITRAHEL